MTMTLSQIASESSATAAKSWKMILLFFAADFLLAVVISLGFHSQLAAGFGSSMLPERLMQGFDATVYDDLLRTSSHLLTPFWTQLFWLVLFSFVLNTLFAGGIIRGLSRGPGSFSLADFFTDCGSSFLRLLVLLVASGVAVLLIGVVWFFVCGILYSFLTAGAIAEPSYVWAFVIAAIVFIVPMVTLLMMIDYAKVAVVLEDERSVLRALQTGSIFVLKNFFSATLWQWIMIVAALLLIVLYWLIEGNLAMATGSGIFVVFLLQQVSVGGRIWVKLTTISGQILLFGRKEAAPVVAASFVPPVAEPLPPVPSEITTRSAPRRTSARKTPRRTNARKRKR